MADIELEKKIARLEDIEAIKQLKALYCDICDDDHNPDRITKIFAPDGSGRVATSARPRATTPSGTIRGFQAAHQLLAAQHLQPAHRG